MVLVAVLMSTYSYGQRKKKNRVGSTSPEFKASLYEGLQWRSIGPFRGGRSAAVTGVPGKPNLYYFGATGGGVWRTTDAGNSWENISDGFFGGSVGAVAVSEWDHNVIYVGGGEVTVRGNVSYGYGMWKSVDAGATWKHIGLKNSRHIPRVRIHPKNPDLVYAAVLGDLYKPTSERGVYKSTDGGATWKRVLFVNDYAGAVDLIMDPTNPRILYASTWRVKRTPYSLESGGEGSALWKSMDGGDTWENISGNEGLPEGTWGISGVTVSPVEPNRVWAIIENEAGGVYRSDDGAKTWKRVNKARKLRQRAWYYTRIYADTQDKDKVYVMNVRYHRSKDGGKTFESYNAPHGDHHDLWISPEDNQRMVIADDGGAQVSFDAGQNWSTYNNQPTAQFYRVVTDNHFPYRIYGAQQDNSTIRISHRSDGSSIGQRDWEPTAGGESAHIAIHPQDNDVVFGGSYGGFLTRKNHKSGETWAVNVWPDNPMGHGAEGMKYRFQWNFPIFFSPHNPNRLYTASNHLHMSTDQGQSWEAVSPDLTRNDSAKLVSSGGPITQDNTGVEYYCTIFAAAESPLEEGLIWTGSDDGLVHVTRNGGKDWRKVTPPGLPEWSMINSLEPDPFVKGGVYLAATRYKLGDYRPYLYYTSDYGNTWQKITGGIPQDHFTRVLRADPKRKGLLYAGTESGMYISFNNGKSWGPLQLNLPIVPITDLAIKNDNLIAATQGRSFWMIDDLTPLHQLNQEVAQRKYHLYEPMPSYRMGGGSPKGFKPKTSGQNHPGGVMVHYYVQDTLGLDTVSLAITEMDGTLIRRFSTAPNKEKMEGKLDKPKPGINRFVWNMRYMPAEKFEGMVMWWVSMDGPKALPGQYKAVLTVGGQELAQTFEIVKNPKAKATEAELKEQFDFMMAVRDKLTETHTTIKQIRKARTQINAVLKRVGSSQAELTSQGKAILDKMKSVEEALYQTKNESPQDPLNFPIRLNNKLGHLGTLSGYGDNPPTAQAKAFMKEVSDQIDEQLGKAKAVFNKDIGEFNKAVYNAKIDAVTVGDTADGI